MAACASCGAENRDDARFCHACGAAQVTAEGDRLRRIVTILFTDVIGSTSLGERLDPEAIADVMTEYFRAVRPVIEGHGGAVAKFMGDAVMAVFGIPAVHEDDALRAVRTAVDLRRVLDDLNPRLESRFAITIATRTGINTGPVASAGLVPDETFVGGDTANVAARLQTHADANGTLLSEATYRLVRDAVVAEPLPPLELKGKAAPAVVYRLVTVGEGLEAHAARHDAPLIGRRGELDALRSAFDAVVSARRCGTTTVVGLPGIGKSRLVREFLRGLGPDATVIQSRCPPYGEGITYWPVIEAVRQAAGLDDADDAGEVRRKLLAILTAGAEAELVAERLEHVLGVSAVAAVGEEIFWAVRKLLEEVARRRPLVLVVDDVHRAEPTLLALLDHVHDHASDSPLLLLCTARPELEEQRPDWAEPRERRSTIELAPLTVAEAGELADSLLGRAGLPDAARARIITAADGNPLFVEHLVAMLVDDGVLHRDAETGAWAIAGDLSALSVPPTIHALLAARLERLTADERRVLGRAAVVGQDFDAAAVTALLPEEIRPHVGIVIADLTARELIAPAEGDGGYRFRHVLIRDVAYDAVGKSVRAELHERLADWLAVRGAPALDELLGFHLERAYGFRAELGRVNEAVTALGQRAAGHLAAAARRALARGDMHAASELWSRALALLDEDAPTRASLLVELGEVLHLTGRFADAKQALEHAAAISGAAGDDCTAANALVALAWLRRSVDPDASFEELTEECARAIPVLDEAGDDAGSARAWRVVMWANGARGRFDAARSAAEHAIRHGTAARDPRVAFDRATLVSSLFYGPVPAKDAEERAVAILAELGDSPAAEANLLVRLGMLRAIQGRIDEGEETIREGAAKIDELGLHIVSTVNAALGLGYVEMLRGDWVAAELKLRRGYDILVTLGETSFQSGSAARLAQALVEQGRNAEALELTLLGEAGGARDDAFTQVLCRAARARVLARLDRAEEGIALAREAAKLALATDVPELQGDALLGLAITLESVGRAGEALDAATSAAERYAWKGHAVSEERARALCDRLLAAGAPA